MELNPVAWDEINGDRDAWDQQVQIAEKLRDKIVKLHRQMYHTSKDTMFSLLHEARRVAMLKYIKQIVILSDMSLDYMHRLQAACVQRCDFLEHKLHLLWSQRGTFDQFEETLLQYELTCEQTRLLELGVNVAEKRVDYV